MTSQRRRLFVGLMPSSDEQRALLASLPPLDPGAKPVRAGNLHLTLAFLGTLDAAPAAAAGDALAAIHGPRIRLDLHCLGHFPRPRVLWVGPERVGDDLRSLHRCVTEALAERGLPVESRPFTPHVTVARRVRRHDGPWRLRAPVRWEIGTLSLVQSQTLPGGARYQVLQTVCLRG